MSNASPFRPADLLRREGSSPASPLEHTFFGEDGLRAGWSLLLFSALLLLFWAAALTAVRAIHHATGAHSGLAAALPPGQTLVNEFASLAVVALPTLIMARLERRPLRVYGIGAAPHARRHLLAGLLCGALLLSLFVGVLHAAGLLVFTGRALSGPSIPRFAAEWFLTFFVVGLFEEYALRGYLQYTLARGLSGILRSLNPSSRSTALGFWIAASLLSFVFGYGHRTNAGESPIGLLSAGLIGLVFGLSLWRTGSLWWAIGFHASWDWAQSFLYGVADSGHLVAFHLLVSHPQGAPLLSGGLTGPEGSLYVLPIILLIVAAILLTTRRSAWPLLPATSHTRQG